MWSCDPANPNQRQRAGLLPRLFFSSVSGNGSCKVLRGLCQQLRLPRDQGLYKLHTQLIFLMYLVCWMVYLQARKGNTSDTCAGGWSPMKRHRGAPRREGVWGGGNARGATEQQRSEPQVEAMETAFPPDSEKLRKIRYRIQKLGRPPEV